MIKGKKAMLVVSFGTSYADTREKTIGAIEKRIAEKFDDYEVRRAFTSKVIIRKLKERDGIEIDTVSEALDRLKAEGFDTVVVQPTYVMNGNEFDGLMREIEPFRGDFKMACGKPLLTDSEDYDRAVDIIAGEVEMVGDKDTAVVFMGHGTEHYADSAYAALDYRFKARGRKNVFVGTVEGYPDTGQVIGYVKKYGYKKAVLLPFMIVAGDHANNDMAGDGDGSWKSEFVKNGIETECIIRGLGEYEEIQEMFAEHAACAVRKLEYA